MRPVNRALTTLPLLILASMLFLLWRGLYKDPSKIPSPLIGKPAPLGAFSSQDLHGKISLVNVWASWCDACAQEHPFLLELSQHKVRLFGIDYKDQASAAREWLQQHGNPYQRVAMDPTGQAAMDWGVYGTPETFVIDKHGIIRYKQVGPINADVWYKELAPLIKKLEQES